jgi:putative membrane protein
MTALTVAALVLLGLAALVHVYIFVLESLLWTRASTRRTFGVRTAEEAQTLKPMAFNQGFYNLFLAIGTVVGIILVVLGMTTAGAALAFLAAGSMVAAAVVLALSSPKLWRAAAIQGVLPLAGIMVLTVTLSVS